MALSITNNIADKYFSFLSKLDTSSKKMIILRLVESIEVKKKKGNSLRKMFGAWEDERSSDDIISDIKNSRVDKQNSIDF